MAVSQVIVADHTVVDKYNDIPITYINEVKKMWVSIAGESHSEAYRVGCELLEATIDNKFQVNVTEDVDPEPYTISHLRISRATWGNVSSSSGWIYSYGEEDWFTSATAINRTKAGLLYCKTNGPALTALGFGWCYDATVPGVSGTADPVYYTKWGGATIGSPEGEKIWGLDAADQTLTGNSVCMDTYLNATDSYIAYCTANNIATKIIFTTGPVDQNYSAGINEGEVGYQQYLKYQHIRKHVNTLSSAYLFDYADILSYNDAGVKATTTWTDRNGVLQTYPLIHSDNNGGSYVAHIGSVGAIRLAKAMWWMLARMAGWDGGGTTADNSGVAGPEEPAELVINTLASEVRIQADIKFLDGRLGLYNMNGSLMEEKVIQGDLTTFSTAGYVPGMYLIVATKSGLRVSRKITLL